MGYAESLKELEKILKTDWWDNKGLPKEFTGPVERNWALKWFEGFYDTEASIDKLGYSYVIPPILEKFQISDEQIINNKAPNGHGTLSRFLTKKKVDKRYIDAIFTAVTKPSKVEITCDFDDILRMSETKHFRTCVSNNGGSNIVQKLFFLMDPYVALIVIRDKNNEFQFMKLCYLLKNEKGETSFMLEDKRYGNGPSSDAIAQAIKKRTDMPVYIGHRGNTPLFLFEPYSANHLKLARYHNSYDQTTKSFPNNTLV